MPGSTTQFAATFGNGVMLVLDKDKEDGSAKSMQQAASLDTSQLGDVAFSVTHPKSKHNPVSRWMVGKGPIHGIAFSSDGKMALCCHDGYARVFDVLSERLLFAFRSQYGGMLCAAWSPDNQYLVTGGEDDLVVVWSYADKCPVARCLGHNSWLSALAFDSQLCAETAPGALAPPGSSYRFHSVPAPCSPRPRGRAPPSPRRGLRGRRR